MLFQTERLESLRLRRQGPSDAYWLVISAEVLMLTVIIFGFQVDVFFFPLKAWWLIASIVVAFLHKRVDRRCSAEADDKCRGGPAARVQSLDPSHAKLRCPQWSSLA